MSGEISTGTIKRRAGNFGSDRPIAVSVPRIVAKIVAPNPINRLLPIAARQRGVPSTTSYQGVENPASGKKKNEPLLNESGTGTKIGTSRKIRTRMHQNQSAATRNRSPVVGNGESNIDLYPILNRSRPR